MATRAEIKLRARRRADMEHSTFVSDNELNEYFQGSYGELYDLLVSSFEDYYVTELPFTIASGASSFPIPTDLYKLRGVDLQINGTVYTSLQQFNFGERNAKSRAVNRVFAGQRAVVYRLMGNNVLLLPETNAPGNYKMWYIPRVTVVAADADQVSGVLDFEEYIVVDCAIKMLTKEESDISALALQKDQLLKRIEAMAQNRDAGAPQTITDVTGTEYWDDTLFPR